MRVKLWLQEIMRRNWMLGVSWWAIFWFVQLRVAFRPYCAQLPPLVIVALFGGGHYPVGPGHIHWCGNDEAYPCEPHKCHVCEIRWYDQRGTVLKLPVVKIDRPAPEDGYGFAVYDAA